MTTRFTSDELRVASDPTFFYLKHQVTQKVAGQLGKLHRALRQTVEAQAAAFPAGWDERPGKISRGENYRLLPYLILDYPRLFRHDTTFAYRTMFWWGHGFSCTLHLQGVFLDQIRPVLQRRLLSRAEPDWWVCVHDSPWEYHFEDDNYQRLTALPDARREALVAQGAFLKLSRRLPLEAVDQLPDFGVATFQEFITLWAKP
ncbi:hypothetical protein SAMN05421823_106110 [Catalinimonas alkaloidigena]|uniref:Uncharacterized protein n=1 Tax=Catalinimonas alkaloidigena TaxID=1075417 RepID=A0A1G9KCA0_9BACT|nr:hypothetical protein [Catalinimonas alkaloidigena]SDL47015.1 hypothetical protein SAMN05421823_106110 [Catalinimonas alkaloidigena]